jgi:hypothetical protein
MRDEDHGFAFRIPELEKLQLQPLAGERIERSERLVHEQHQRVGCQGPRNRNTLAHPAGDAIDVVVRKWRKADEVDIMARDPVLFRIREIAAIFSRLGPSTSCPLTRTRPVVGVSSPPTMRITVVLPQPDGPTNTTNSPSAIDSDKGSTTGVAWLR